MEVIRTSIVQSACAVMLLVVLLHLGMKLPVAMDANALISREEMAVISRNMTTLPCQIWFGTFSPTLIIPGDMFSYLAFYYTKIEQIYKCSVVNWFINLCRGKGKMSFFFVQLGK